MLELLEDLNDVGPVSERLDDGLVAVAELEGQIDGHKDGLHSETSASANEIVPIISRVSIDVGVCAIILIPDRGLCPEEGLELCEIKVPIELKELINVGSILH